MSKQEQFAEEFAAKSETLVDETVTSLYRRSPEMKARYGAAGRQRCREDIAYHFCVLGEAVSAGDENIFLKYVAWGKSVLINRKVKTGDLIECLLIMQDITSRQVSKPAADRANEFIELALDTFDSFAEGPPSCIDPTSALTNIANAYLEALLSSDRQQARKVIEAAERNGIGMAEIYQHVFQPVQREVGRLWQVNQITVAQEHYCTAMTETMMSEVHARAESGGSDHHLFVGACVAGEQHSIGIRMVCEVMETNGWRVYCTGANTPASSIIDLVRRFEVNVMGLSCATAINLAAIRQVIGAVRESAKGTRIMVGGRMFNEFPGLWKKVGADGFAEDATTAIRVAAKLAGVKRAEAVKS